MVNSIHLTKAAKGKGAIVAMVAGTKAETVIAIIEKSSQTTESVTEITFDMAANMGLLLKNVFQMQLVLSTDSTFKKLA
jgi:hypothetical protein